MQKIVPSVLLLLLIMWSSLSAWAQESCPNDFSRINSNCIRASNKKFTTKPIVLSNELQDNMYFYKTAGGDFGKIKVIGTTITKEECTLFIEAVTFSKGRIFVPNSSISIGVSQNHWLKDRVLLDRNGLSAFELSKPEKIVNLLPLKVWS